MEPFGPTNTRQLIEAHATLKVLDDKYDFEDLIQCPHPPMARNPKAQWDSAVQSHYSVYPSTGDKGTQLKVFSELSLAIYTIIPAVMFSLALQIEFQDWPIGRRNRQEIPKFGKSFSDLFLVDRARSVRWANLWKHFSLRNFFPLDVSSEGPSTKVG